MITFFKIVSFFTVLLILIIQFRNSAYYKSAASFITKHYKYFFIVTLVMCVIYLINSNVNPRKIEVNQGFILFYKIISFCTIIATILLYIREKNRATFFQFFTAHYPKIISFIALCVISYFFINNLHLIEFHLFDIFAIIYPFFKLFIAGSIFLFLFLSVIHKVKNNVVLINYTELAIYIIAFSFFSWMAISTFFSFSIVQRSIEIYVTETKQLPKRYIFILYSIFSFIIITLLMFIYVMASRILKTVFEIIRRYLRVQYQDAIINYVYGSSDLDTTNASLQFLKRNANKSSFRRSLILRELTFLHRSLSGQIISKTKEIYNNIQLFRDSLQSLKKGSWSKKIKAMGELSLMDFKESEIEIKKFLLNKNELLRKEAQIALVKLNNTENALLFLIDYKYQLTDYEQIKLLHAIKRNKINNINVVALLDSNNETVIAFALKLIGVFEQIKNFDRVIPFLIHDNPTICAAALFALKKLCLPKASFALMDSYFHQTSTNKIRLLEVLEQIPVIECHDWLIDLINNTDDYRTKLTALRVLNKIENLKGNIGVIFSMNDLEMELLIKHVIDKRI